MPFSPAAVARSSVNHPVTELPSITFVFFRLANSGSDRARRPPLLPLLAVPMRRRRATELRRRGQRNEAGDGEQQRSPGRESH
jgi:hypothetical protein